MAGIVTRFPDVAEVKMVYNSGGQSAQNVYHVYNAAGPWTETTLNDLCIAVGNWEVAVASVERQEDCQWLYAIATDLTDLNHPRITFAPTAPTPGGHTTSDLAPNNVTIAFKASTSKRGRGRQGRVFWIGLAEDMIANQQLGSSHRTSIGNALNGLIDAVHTADPDWHLVVAHSWVDKVHLAVGTHDAITRYELTDTYLDSQKLRLPNHKRARHT